MAKVGDGIKVDYLKNDGKTIDHSKIKTIKNLEIYNQDLYMVTFKEDVGTYAFTMDELDNMLL